MIRSSFRDDRDDGEKPRLETRIPAAVFLNQAEIFSMHLAALKVKDFVCEVCGDGEENAATVGAELERGIISPIRLCHRCGPIDIELMELCREITVGCMNH